MLTLDLPTEPYWHGVRVEIRPVTTAVMAAAQTATARRLAAIRIAPSSSTQAITSYSNWRTTRVRACCV